MNFEKYNKIHDEVMKRLEDGEITTEMAKEVNDLAYEKYIRDTAITESTESAVTIGLAIAGGSLALGVTIWDIVQSVRKSRKYKKFKEDTHTLEEYNSERFDILDDLEKAKSISFHPNTIQVLKKTLDILEQNKTDLMDIDVRLFHCKSDEIYYRLRKTLITKYKEFDTRYTQRYNQLSKLVNSLKTKAEYVDDKDAIIPLLKKYLKFEPYYRVNEPNDLYNEVDFLKKSRPLNDEEDENDTYTIDKKVCKDVYECFMTFDNDDDIYKAEEILKYIKVSFK